MLKIYVFIDQWSIKCLRMFAQRGARIIDNVVGYNYNNLNLIGG